MAGGSAFTDFFTKTIPRAFRSTHDFVKKNKLISQGLSFLPHPVAKIGGITAGALGYGHRRGMRGGGRRRGHARAILV